MQLNEEQADALDKIKAWLRFSDSQFFVLSGSAGTGKTFTSSEIILSQLDKEVITAVTAPTNKAVRVLRTVVGVTGEDIEFRTIYSLLGLKLVAAHGTQKIITDRSAKGGAYLRKYRLVVVDEASMVNSSLMKFIREKAITYRHLKFLFLGDPVQLPPVDEVVSPVWNIEAPRAHLTKVMRHDNQILRVCTQIRDAIETKGFKVRIGDDFDIHGGVRRFFDRTGFERSILKHAGHAKSGFRRGDTKVIAWTNKAVERFNRGIRSVIWKDVDYDDFMFDERVMFAGPVYEEDVLVASTDDEGRIVSVIRTEHPDYPDFKITELKVETDEGNVVTAQVIDRADEPKLKKELSYIAEQAKDERRHPYERAQLWDSYWALRDAFHDVRYGYALTAHRSQGSTFTSVFADCTDIHRNPNKEEAFRCMYVACSRPSTNLIVG